MTSQPIITSILDTDLYKFSMLQAVWHQYPKAHVTYSFVCRTPLISLCPDNEPQYTVAELVNVKELRRQVKLLKDLPFLRSDALFMYGLDYMDRKFVTDLVDTCPMKNANVNIVAQTNGNIDITISGTWWETILYEVPVLAIISEMAMKTITELFACKCDSDILECGRKRLESKIEMIKEFPGIKFADFGTRRRYSKEWHEEVVKILKNKCPNCIGTSNLWFAQKYGMKPIGTVAHEWFSAHLGLVDRIEKSQKRALHVWQQEFGSRLGIALTDTFTTDAFFRDFDFPLARAYDGLRHDSGCPFEFTEKALSHYESIGIDSRRKTIVYSDGLDFPKMIEIWKRYSGKVGIAFGIGTNLTNDCGLTPMNIVIKLTGCNDKPCIKLSDVPGKEIGNPGMIQMVKRAYEIKS